MILWVVGCCAHVISVLWFLGYFRNNNELKQISTQYIDYYIDAAKFIEEPESMSDDDLEY